MEKEANHVEMDFIRGYDRSEHIPGIGLVKAVVNKKKGRRIFLENFIGDGADGLEMLCLATYIGVWHIALPYYTINKVGEYLNTLIN